MKKISKKQIVKYFGLLLEAEDSFNANVAYIENIMQKETGIKDIEFFWSDGYCGIGNASRTMKLIHRN